MKQLHVSNRWLQQCQGTWTNILHDTVQRYPEGHAIVFRHQQITYREVWQWVNQLARGLYAIGVRSGDHVGLWMVNRPEFIYARFAIHQLGAVMVPLHTRYKSTELDYVLRQSDCSYLIMEDNFLGSVDAMKLLVSLAPEMEKGSPGSLTLEHFPLLKGVVCLGSKTYPGCFSWDEVLNMGRRIPEEHIVTTVAADAISHIMYTSGTTGFPKGAVQTYKNNIACFSMTSELTGIEHGDKLLCVIPFYGNIGMWLYSLCVLEGATAVIDETFEAERALRLIQNEKISHVMLLGPMAVSILEHPDFSRYDLGSINWIFYCMGFKKTGYQLQKAFPSAAFCNGYGLVEGSGLQTFIPRGSTIDQVIETVGVPLPYCEQVVMNPETGETLEPGMEGEICTREKIAGTHFMRGYYKQPELTAATFKDGWLHTGDLGKMDINGFTYLTGRVKEMLKVGGFNIAPAEVEEVIMTHSRVAQVAVVGVPDHRLTEVPVAFVVPKYEQEVTPAEIIDYCKNRLANIRVPRHVFLVSELPTTPQSKIQKFRLREQAIKELQLEELADRK